MATHSLEVNGGAKIRRPNCKTLKEGASYRPRETIHHAGVEMRVVRLRIADCEVQERSPADLRLLELLVS